MFTTLALYLALSIFGIGLVLRVSSWFRYGIGIEAKGYTSRERLVAAARGIASTLLSPKIATLLKVFVLDVILLRRTLRQDRLRWIAHMLIFGGFVMLLLMHALDTYTTSALFTDYYPTLNPFLFLRNVFGVAVFFGVALVAFRRALAGANRPRTSAMDIYAIAILAVIMASGFLLEGSKILSERDFQRMAGEYAAPSDEQELKALKTYWIDQFGLDSSSVQGPVDASMLEQGRVQHEMNCAQCHSSPRWAFGSFAASKVLHPVASVLDRAHAATVLWYVHFLACMFGLAYLPFSKMFHIVAAPLSLMANAVMEKGKSHPANIATKQVLELDACTHCGACTQECSVAVTFEAIPNENILPSEKMASLRLLASGAFTPGTVAAGTVAAGTDPLRRQLKTIQQGLHLCTNCYRCTAVCPSGINLAEMWVSVREALLQREIPEPLLLSPLSYERGMMMEALDRVQYEKPLHLAHEAIASEWDQEQLKNRSFPLVPGNGQLVAKLNGSLKATAYSNCFRCTSCSLACPVVRNYQNAEEVLGLLPHQIMHAVGLRLWDIVFSSRMLWNCLGCYQCQEHCPQCVRVADVLYELKNVAIAKTNETPAMEEKERA